jgi:hypothetical protein
MSVLNILDPRLILVKLIFSHMWFSITINLPR